MRLDDLVAAPGLGIRVLHGDEDDLARPLGWIYTTDLPDPSRYLAAGQTLMTGMMWRADEADSEPFVRRLVESGAAALIVGDALFDHVPADVVQACRRWNLPLLAVPTDVSFARVTEYVAGQQAQRRLGRLTEGLVRQRQLLAEMAAGRTLDELVRRIARETGLGCRVLSSTGRQIAASGPPLAERDLDQLLAQMLPAQRFPAPVGTPAGAGTAFLVGAASQHRAVAWFVLAEHPDGGTEPFTDPETADPFHELAAIAALERRRTEDPIRARRELVDQVIALLDEDADRPEIPLLLRQLGLDLDRPTTVVVLQPQGPPTAHGLTGSLLGEAVGHLSTPVVGSDAQGHAVALVSVPGQGPSADPAGGPTGDSGPGADPAALIRRALLRVTPALPGIRLDLGVSRPTDPGGLAGALRAARYARLLATGLPGDPADPADRRVRMASGDRATSAVMLLSAVPDRLRRSFAGAVLDGVVEYDRRTGADLLVTLRAFLDCNGSWSRTAQQLHLHLNTVRYRITRVEELTGRDLSRMDDRADVYLALHLL
ncbi:PucR family transcriptional regulator [Nakamurella sp.]|uniref:PucR family transcriptional regulator n=1 Tax=Nakamurella sp. TaxID=1869182 RepID=UPI003B3BA980